MIYVRFQMITGSMLRIRIFDVVSDSRPILQLCHSTGSFQLQLTDLSASTVDSPQQQYVYRLCLKQYQRVIDTDSPCAFGQRQSAPFTLPLKTDQETLTLPYSFAWPVSRTRSFDVRTLT